MEFFHSNNHKLQPKEKKRLTQDQVRLLETSFNHDKKLEPELKMHLARDLGLHPRKVAIWYQNRRARWKSQSLELDCKALQLRLDAALADKRRLEREVARLKAELEKAQEKLLGVSNPLQPRPSSLSSSCDDDGSSTLPGNLNCCWENAGAYQVEELYAFLMGAEAQTGN